MNNNRREIQINKGLVTHMMKEAKIPGVSIASFDLNGPTSTLVLGVDRNTHVNLSSESVFRAASLSKPAFSYLVQKLIKENILYIGGLISKKLIKS